MYARFRLEDMEGTVDVVCFSSNYPRYKNLIYNNGLLQITGHISRFGNLPKVVIDKSSDLASLRTGNYCISPHILIN